MASVNKVIIVGNLGRIPRTRTFPSGERVATSPSPPSERWKDKQTGE
jgi:single-stranded DNA-binding protein